MGTGDDGVTPQAKLGVVKADLFVLHGVREFGGGRVGQDLTVYREFCNMALKLNRLESINKI